MVRTFPPSRPELVPSDCYVTGRVGPATCPGCHTPHPTLTVNDVTAGAHWVCPSCAGRWDARRLATAAAYAVWVADRDVPGPAGARFNTGGDV